MCDVITVSCSVWFLLQAEMRAAVFLAMEEQDKLEVTISMN